MPLRFQLLSIDGGARRGRLETARSTVETPAFMPVGTLANVKTLLPSDVAGIGYGLILANTYHLHLQPGEDVVAGLGGVQTMMGWRGSLLTDSGGYQVFSLANLREVSEEGVVFQTSLGERRLTPESAMAIQAKLGSDIAMVLDVCPPIDAPLDAQREAAEITHRWAVRSLASPAADDQSRFPIVQGGQNPDLRRESARFIGSLDGDGCAIGGLSLGESKEITWEMTAIVTAELPRLKPRYLMGVGGPDDLVEGVAHGVDLFDSVLPTRIARHGAVWTRDGRLNLRNRALAADNGPIDLECPCYACREFSRGWIRALHFAGDPLGMRLTSIHNLTFLFQLMSAIRESIAAGTFSSFSAGWLERYRTAT